MCVWGVESWTQAIEQGGFGRLPRLGLLVKDGLWGTNQSINQSIHHCICVGKGDLVGKLAATLA